MARAEDPAPPPAMPSDWPAQAAGKIEEIVGQVRDKTTGPALKVADYVVYGLAAIILGTVAIVLMLAGLVRLMDSYLPEEVWLPYLILGTIFTLLGLFLWTRRGTRHD